MTSTEQLEMETEQTRARLAATLEELKSMTPGRVLDEVLDYAKDSGADALRGMGRQISENPMPAVLIGAGIAWMMMGNAKATAPMPRPNGDGTSWGDSTAGSLMHTGSELSAKAGSAAQSVKDSAISAANGLSTAASTISDKASGAYDAVAGTASRTASTMKSAASTVAQSGIALEQSALAATRGLVDFCKDQPLVLAGLGLAIGAALGSAIPETEAEDRLMGETADQVKEKAQQLASEQYETAKKVGQHVVDETAKITKQELAGVVGDRQDDMQNPDRGSAQGGQSAFAPLSGQPDLQTDEEDSKTGLGGDINTMGDQQRPIH